MDFYLNYDDSSSLSNNLNLGMLWQPAGKFVQRKENKMPRFIFELPISALTKVWALPTELT